MAKKSLGAQTLSYPLPVYLVGSYDAAGKANVMTAAWGGICCSVPPCLCVAIQKPRHSYAAILERRAFTVSIPTASMAAEADYFGLASGRKVDKFAVTGLTPVKSDLVDAPYVGECPVVLELSLAQSVELGSHTLFVGKIEDVKAESAWLNADGLPDFVKMGALIYSRDPSSYQVPGKKVADAFSIGKKFL